MPLVSCRLIDTTMKHYKWIISKSTDDIRRLKMMPRLFINVAVTAIERDDENWDEADETWREYGSIENAEISDMAFIPPSWHLHCCLVTNYVTL